MPRKPKYYREPLKPHLKHEQVPLGKSIGQLNIIPSNKFFFDNYAYKVSLQGNVIYHDIQHYQDFVSWLRNKTYDYREKSTLGAINIYLREKSVLEEICDKFKDLVVSITGPIDQEHLDMLLEGQKRYEYRNSYWYGEYDLRVETTTTHRHQITQEGIADYNKKLYSFVHDNVEKYKWYVPEYQTKTYFNYLYLNEQAWNEFHPFLKLSFPGVIRSITKCLLIDK